MKLNRKQQKAAAKAAANLAAAYKAQAEAQAAEAEQPLSPEAAPQQEQPTEAAPQPTEQPTEAVKAAAKAKGPAPTLYLTESFSEVAAHLRRDLRAINSGRDTYYNSPARMLILEKMATRVFSLAIQITEAQQASQKAS